MVDIANLFCVFNAYFVLLGYCATLYVSINGVIMSHTGASNSAKFRGGGRVARPSQDLTKGRLQYFFLWDKNIYFLEFLR